MSRGLHKSVLCVQLVAALLISVQCLQDVGKVDRYHRNGRSRRATSSELKRAVKQTITFPYADWNQVARDELAAAKSRKPRETVAKNVILVIGDGMGISTQTAARMLKAQQEDLLPHMSKLSWESFPYTGLSKTYNSDVLTGDSAATATAFLCGEKGRQGTIGLNDAEDKGSCENYEQNKLKSILKHAMDQDKWGGIVTTTRVTHATPAGAYASVANRDWEGSVPVACNSTVPDITQQLIYGGYGDKLRVVLGGGRKHFLPEEATDPERPEVKGTRKDGVNLIDEWKRLRKDNGIADDKFKYVQRLSEFEAVNSQNTDYLLGLFEPDHTNYEVDRENDLWKEPSLTQNVEKALEILQRSEKGYFMLIEGGRIDHAHHDNLAKRSLEETLELERAVAKVKAMTSEDDTLLIVTADHSHTFALGANMKVGNDVLGYVVDQFGDTLMSEDEKPQYFFGYTNGPGWQYHRSQTNDFSNEILRRNISEDLDSGFAGGNDFPFDGPVPLQSEYHGAEEVGIFARGPMAHLLSGIHEQNYVAHLSMYAACVGPYQSEEHCDGEITPPACGSNSLLLTTYMFVLSFVVSTFVSW